jgi:hypothetical protein
VICETRADLEFASSIVSYEHLRDLTTGVQDEREYSSRIERTGGAVKRSGLRHRIIHDEERRHPQYFLYVDPFWLKTLIMGLHQN